MSNTYRDTTNFTCPSKEAAKLSKKGKLAKKLSSAMFDKTADPTSSKRKKVDVKKTRRQASELVREELVNL